MANIQINITENGTTTLATSGCICDRNIDINVEVPKQGFECDGRHIPDDALLLTGTLSNTFPNNKWAWFIRDYGNEITTENIGDCSYTFDSSTQIEDIPFETNYTTSDTVDMQSTYRGCTNLKHIGAWKNGSFYYFQNVFYNCYNLRYLPEFINCDFTGCNRTETPFYNCYSLRSIPEDFLKNFNSGGSTALYHYYGNMCYSCVALDELKCINPHPTKTYSSNIFADAFYHCYRLKDLTFDVQEDGTPYTCKWKGQVIDLSKYVGYVYNAKYLSQYNSGITEDKEVYDDATYQALKNDPDWFTNDVYYSRYNHDSAVNTINSLPDCSAYIGTSGTVNTIKFKGESGRYTDGGAINTLTEEEIAVATAKGWTVQIV